jgi:imidazole glycerol-phosphate synthase subunit HisF
MLKTRVIPVVLWDGMNCVQTVQFGRPARVFGSLMDAVKVYERRNVDELILLDIATNPGWGPRFDAVMEYTKELFCPVTIGGGISELAHIERALRAGADKVAIRKGCLDQKFLSAATQKFGAQAIVAAVDVRHDGNVIFDSTWNAPFKDSISAAQWAQTMELFDVGEILLTSIERNGAMTGYDDDLIREVADAVDIPVIANGGCGIPPHMLTAIKAGAHAVAASTMFLFTDTVPQDCKRYLDDHGIAVRLT